MAEMADVIEYDWPSIDIPDISLSRLLVEKLIFFSTQTFLVDHGNESRFLYRHVYMDTIRTVAILKANRICPDSVVGISGNSDYKHVISLLAALILQCKVVLIPKDLTADQKEELTNKCRISFMLENSNHVRKSELKNPFLISYNDNFSRSEAYDRKYLIENRKLPLENDFLAWSPSKRSKGKRASLMVPRFENQKLANVHWVDEDNLLVQLIYANLPLFGFEWNINDVILSTSLFDDLLGIIALLTCLCGGSQIVINTAEHVTHKTSLQGFAHLIRTHQVSATIMHSAYLSALYKSTPDIGNSLKKVLYTDQPIHKQTVNLFQSKFNITTCRFILFLLEAGGFVAIETGVDSLITTPLPRVAFRILNPDSCKTCSYRELGNLHVRTNDIQWLFTGYMGYTEDGNHVQIIDYSHNFIKIRGKLYSRSLIESMLLAQESVQEAKVMAVDEDKDRLEVFVSLSSSSVDTTEDELRQLLDGFDDAKIQWKVTIVDEDRLPSTIRSIHPQKHSLLGLAH